MRGLLACCGNNCCSGLEMPAPLRVPFCFQLRSPRGGSDPRERCLQAWKHLDDSLPGWNESVQCWACSTQAGSSGLAMHRILIWAGPPREWDRGATAQGRGFLNSQGAGQ